MYLLRGRTTPLIATPVYPPNISYGTVWRTKLYCFDCPYWILCYYSDTGVPSGTVTIGKGEDIASGAIFKYNDTLAQVVNGAGFTASAEAIATWKFTADQGKTTNQIQHVKPNNDRKYRWIRDCSLETSKLFESKEMGFCIWEKSARLGRSF